MLARKIIVAIILLMVAPVNVYGWISQSLNYTGNTHYKLTNDAIGLIDSNSCQYVPMFSKEIKKWTTNLLNDTEAHGGNLSDNGGNPKFLWEKAEAGFDSGNIAGGKNSAYHYIALIIHLIEDQAVPAHAYEISHTFDGVEAMAFNNYVPNNKGIINSSGPIDSYDEMINATLALTSSTYWRDYWVKGSYAHGIDIFPSFWEVANDSERDLLGDLLGYAVGYAAGALKAMSEEHCTPCPDIKCKTNMGLIKGRCWYKDKCPDGCSPCNQDGQCVWKCGASGRIGCTDYSYVCDMWTQYNCREIRDTRDCPHPDDNVDVSTLAPQYKNLSNIDQNAIIGILDSYYAVDMFKILSLFKEQARIVSSSFSPDIFKQMPVLLTRS